MLPLKQSRVELATIAISGFGALTSKRRLQMLPLAKNGMATTMHSGTRAKGLARHAQIVCLRHCQVKAHTRASATNIMLHMHGGAS